MSESFDLEAACEPVGRNPRSVRRFVARPVDDVEANARRLAWFTDAELLAELSRRGRDKS